MIIILGVLPLNAAGPLDHYGHTSLYKAVIFEDGREVERLIKAGANVNFQTSEEEYPGSTALIVAASKSNPNKQENHFDAKES